MSEQFILTANSRSDLGKGASRRLRREADAVPAIIYGAGKPAATLSFTHKEILKVIEHEAFFSSIVGIVIDGKTEKAILKDLQRHPSKASILHMDFMRVSASEKLTLNVPLHFIGEKEAPGVKEGGVVTRHLSELEVKCLPANLPEYIEIDISELALDAALHISHIKLPTGVELATAIEDEAHDHSVVSISLPKVAEEVEAAETTTAADEVPSAQKDDAADKANDEAKEAKEKAEG